MAERTMVLGTVTPEDAEALRRAGMDVVAVGHEELCLQARSMEDPVVISAAALAQMVDAQSTFFELLSHELNTPLTVVLGYATTLVAHWDEVDDLERRAWVDAMRRRARQMTRLVDQSMALLRVDSGGLTLRQQRIHVFQAVAGAVEGHPEDDIEVKVSCPADLMAAADMELTGMVLSTFIDNAVTYGEPPFEVIASEVGAAIEVRVADSGPGVPDEFIPHLFERFSQASTGTTRTARGIGLGLSLARSLARLQGGDVWYERRSPRGSCFGLRLPASLASVPLPARLVSRAAELARESASDDDAVAELIVDAGGNRAAVEEARRRCLRLGFTLPSCRRAARLLALVAAEAS